MDSENSLSINIEAIDDASEVLLGVSDTAGEMATELEGAAKEANAALQTISTGALDMASSVDEAAVSAGEGMTTLGEDATASGLETSVAMQNMSSSILSASEESVASVNELNAVMAADSEGISADAIAVGTSWDESAAMVLSANEEISTSSSSTQGGMAGLAAALLLVSQYLKQMSGAVEGEIGNAYKATGDWNQSLLELEQTLKNTASSVPINELTDFTKTMQDTTLFQQEAVLQSENLVMTHKDLQSSYQQIIGLSADLATKMAQQTGGTADLGNATRLLTNAFSDPVTAMNRLINQAGVDIPYAMQQAITKTAKAGDTAAASALLMKELTSQIGGLATASAQASGTGMEKLNNDFQSLQQNMPGVTDAMDNLAKILDTLLKPLAAWIEAHPKLTADILLTVAAILSLLAAVASFIALAVLFVVAVAAGITGTMVAWIAAIIAVIAGVVALGVAVIVNWDKIKIASQNLWEAIKTTASATINWLTDLFEAWYNKVMGWISSIMNSVKSIGSSIGGGISGAASSIGGALSSLIPHFATGGVVNGPTLALVGESGPEAIVPLNQIGGGGNISALPSGTGNGGGINVYITGTIQSTGDQARILGNEIARQINRQLKLSSFK